MSEYTKTASKSARLARQLCLLACGTAMSTFAAHASADEQSADTAAARAFAVDGLKLADSGHCDQAIDKLSRAEKLHHSPIVLGKLGECLVAQGRVVEGSEALRRMLREPLPPNPSQALSKAYERAQAALDQAKPQIATVTIVVKAPNGVEPSVTIDGQAVPTAVLGADRPTDPGEHMIEATAQGYLKASTKFNVGPGRRQSVELALERDPDAPVAPPPGTAPSAANAGTGEAASGAAAGSGALTSQADATANPAADRTPNRTAAYVTWAVSGAVLGAGAVFGFIAMKDKNDLSDKCSENVCPRDQQDKLDSAKRAGTIATIGLGAGAAGVVLGTVLFFTAGPSSEESTQAGLPSHRKRRLAHTGLRPRASVGLGRVDLALDF